MIPPHLDMQMVQVLVHVGLLASTCQQHYNCSGSLDAHHLTCDVDGWKDGRQLKKGGIPEANP